MPLPERLKFIKEAGFDSTIIWWENEQGCPEIPKEDMPRMVKDAGLFLENIHVPYNNSNDLWSENSSVRSSIVKQHLEWMEDCARFDIPTMVMHLTGEYDVPKPNKYGVESLSMLTRKAEELGVKIAVENTNPTEGVEFILSEISSKQLGLCYDSSHAQLYGGGKTLINRFKDRLISTHLSDNDGRGDRHWLPGNGIIDWSSFCQNFPHKHYKGFLTLEVCPTKEERSCGPQEFIQKAFESISWINELMAEN